MSPHLTRTLAAGLAAAALAAPVAHASPARDPGPGYGVPVDGTTEPVDARAVTTTVDDEFDWGAAAIGAGGAAMVILLSLGGAAHASRHRARISGV